MSSIRVILFKGSYDSFISALDSGGIKYKRRIQLAEPSTIMNAGSTIEVFSAVAQATPWGVLAIIIIAWLNERKSRKVIITKKNNEVLHIRAEGYSAKDVEGFIESSKNIMVIDTSNKNET